MRTKQSSVATYDPMAAAALQPTAAGTVRIPSVLRCALMIFAMRMSLKIRAFGPTIAWIRRRVETVRPAAPIRADLVTATEHAVAMAGAFYPGRAKCLEQSLALYYLLRRQGVPVRYRQGVQFYPFQAHAWVEYQGEVMNDVAEHVKHFTRLPDQLP
jgi:hypothetical protein